MEWMDQPGISFAEHQLALKGLARLNAVSGAHGKVWKALAEALEVEKGPREPVRVIDIATGGGDLPICLFKRARAAGIDLRILAVDRAEGALHHALASSEAAGVPADLDTDFPDRPGIHFAVADALQKPLALPKADWVTSSLFLHHLTGEEARDLLHCLAEIAEKGLVIADLDRGWLNTLLVTLGSYLLSRSPLVHHDGPASIRAAFSRSEAEALVGWAGLGGATVKTAFPGMWVMRLVRN
jgi:hypothetical protein